MKIPRWYGRDFISTWKVGRCIMHHPLGYSRRECLATGSFRRKSRDRELLLEHCGPWGHLKWTIRLIRCRCRLSPPIFSRISRTAPAAPSSPGMFHIQVDQKSFGYDCIILFCRSVYYVGLYQYKLFFPTKVVRPSWPVVSYGWKIFCIFKQIVVGKWIQARSKHYILVLRNHQTAAREIGVQ